MPAAFKSFKMDESQEHRRINPITYSCYSRKIREGEQFIPDHVFSFQISGMLTMSDGENKFVFTDNTFRLTRRNSMLKFVKEPGVAGEYRNVSIFLDQQTLKSLSSEYGFKKTRDFSGPPVIAIRAHQLLISYIASLPPYDDLSDPKNELLKVLKMKELIVLLLEVDPGLKDLLFDFSEPGKIDIESFMNRNFRFNLSLERFGYLTGRSLSTFKRDFEKVFHIRPGKWLQQKRLQEAHFLIREKAMPASEAFIEAGFENLSHFSYAYKKAYGHAPTKPDSKGVSGTSTFRG
jgi:AraC-like DNA-binding protein